MGKQPTICYSIKASWHMISRMYNSYAIHQDISISTAYILLNLSMEKGVPSTQIGPLLGMESRSLTRTLKSMEEEGLVRRHHDTKDKRLVYIYLTDKGREKRRVATAVVKQFNKAIYHEISAGEMDTFLRVLDKINDIAENNHDKNKEQYDTND